LPPTIIDRLAAVAPCPPPETGASSISTPSAASRPAIERAVCGAMVLMSTRIEPAANPSLSPPAAKAVCSTSASAVTIVNTTSAADATAAGLAQATAPAASSGCAASCRRAHTASR